MSNITYRQAIISIVGKVIILLTVAATALVTYVIADVLYATKTLSAITALVAASIILFLETRFLRLIQWLFLGGNSDERMSNLIYCYTLEKHSGFFSRKEKVLKMASINAIRRLKRAGLSDGESDRIIQSFINEKIGEELSSEVDNTRQAADERIRKMATITILNFGSINAQIGIQKVEQSKQLDRHIEQTLRRRKLPEIPVWVPGILAMVLFPVALAIGTMSIGLALYLVLLLVNPYMEAVRELYSNLYLYFFELFYG